MDHASAVQLPDYFKLVVWENGDGVIICRLNIIVQFLLLILDRGLSFMTIFWFLSKDRVLNFAQYLGKATS